MSVADLAPDERRAGLASKAGTPEDGANADVPGRDGDVPSSIVGESACPVEAVNPLDRWYAELRACGLACPRW